MIDPARWFTDRPGAGEWIALVVLAVCGCVLSFALRSTAFPPAPVDLSVSRADAERLAADALREAGAEPDAYRVASRFNRNGRANRFYQLTFDRERYEEFVRTGVPIWYWSIRFFKPGEPEEWFVRLAPDGSLLGRYHALPPDAPGTDLVAGRARAIAEAQATERLGIDLSAWEPISAREKKLAHRTDHTLVYKRKDGDVFWSEDPDGEPATVELSLTVNGDVTDSHWISARTPEAFDRAYRRLRQMGGLTLSVYRLVAFCFVAWIFACFLRAYKADDLRWRFAVRLGVAMGIFYALYAANRIPKYITGYDTAKDFGIWLARLAVEQIGLAVPVGLVYVLGLAAAESIGRRTLPAQTALLPALGGRAILSRETARAIAIGVLLGGIWLGVGIVYHAAAKDLFGAWSPLRSPYSSVLVNFVPALTPMVMSLNAGMAEETAFRLAGFALLFGATRRAWIAILVPAFVWSLAHAGYEFIPFYTRLVELTLVGALFGLALLRYGIVPCIVAHYFYDAVVMNVSLLTSGRADWIAGAAVVIALPIAIAVFGAALNLKRHPPGPGRPAGVL